MYIGVYGSAAGVVDDLIKQKARALGKAIAQYGHVLVTGGCIGLPQEAVLGAAEMRGKCIAYSPAISLEEHINHGYPTQGFSSFVPPTYEHAKDPRVCRKYRNVSSLAAVDIALFISGRIGTMNEVTIAYDLEKTIGILKNTGGITDRAIQILFDDAAKKGSSSIVWEEDPEQLVERTIAAHRLR
ncbi:hypothetical protein HZB02_07450 [Candidatus Woesearchaeota archaeon]|nr:hypothetical protein [Candidatus Woesearchaeota archaeon]